MTTPRPKVKWKAECEEAVAALDNRTLLTNTIEAIVTSRTDGVSNMAFPVAGVHINELTRRLTACGFLPAVQPVERTVGFGY